MLRVGILLAAGAALAGAAEPQFGSQLIFPLEHWHNHSSSIVETPNGGLLAVWFHGSGERKADDARVQGARLAPGAEAWSERFTAAEYPDFPDTNATLLVDPFERLWLFWMTFVANEVEGTILSYKVSSDFEQAEGPPKWDRERMLLFQPDLDRMERKTRRTLEPLLDGATPERIAHIERVIRLAGDKFQSRMGWMVRTHPVVLPSGRMLLGVYSDTYDFSLVVYSDDGGVTWTASEPIVGLGNVQPSIVRRKDGILAAYMRDNGPEPKRVLRAVSADEGVTWSTPVDTELPNPGSSVEVIRLESGEWLMVGNDTEEGRWSLAAMISGDEGETWKWKRHLELDEREAGRGAFSYPSVIQASDGRVHVTYSYHLNHLPERAPRKAIKHAWFAPEWVKAGSD